VIDLPAAAAATAGGTLGLSLGRVLGDAFALDLELSASEAESDIKIVSSPRLITANMKPAYIKQGTLVPIVTPPTSESPATTELVDAVLLLQVTPQITADKDIVLDILVTKDAPTTVGGLTGISKKEIKTNVLLKNGETIVIGGIYTREDNVADDGVPGLKDIPILGWLFKKNTKIDNRTELLIFLTPRVIEQTPVAAAN
jgi:type IV pilus assembly protein PilQ